MNHKRTDREPVVLIAEDDAATASMLAGAVEEAGATPMVAHDGAQALTLASAQPPDLVITDLMMPHLDGAALIAALHGRVYPTLPVILITGSSWEQARRAGADAIMAKPFRLSDLVALVERYVVA